MSEKKDYQKKNKISTYFKCDRCDHKAQKPETLRKHINRKHTKHKCKVYGKEFKISMQIVSHVANEHVEKEEWNVEFHSMPKEEGNG